MQRLRRCRVPAIRFFPLILAFLVAVLVGACDFWPKDLKPLADSISRQVSGETTAWLVSGDVVIIGVAGSPLYRQQRAELVAVATDIAEQAVAYIPTPLESIAITFHEGEISEDPEKMRQFIYLVTDNRPVLQPYIDEDATGPLGHDELAAAVDRLGDSVTGAQRDCVLAEAEQRASAAGDPETLDPASIEFLTAGAWDDLDAFARRLFLAQALTSKAVFVCAAPRKAGTNS